MLPTEVAIYKQYLKTAAPNLQKAKGDPWKIEFDTLLKYGSFLLDGWGTLYSETSVYPGVLESMAQLRKSNKNIRLLTNAASRSIDQIQSDLHLMGLDFDKHEIISSGSLLKVLNEGEGIGLKEVYYLGGPSGMQFLEDAKIEAVQNPSEPTVVLSGISPTQEEMDKAIEILSEKDARILVLNPDVYAPSPSGEKIPVTGYIANMLKEKTNCQLLFCGKPFSLIFQIALRSLIPSTESVIMIGDTLGTDIAGASIAGIDSALVLGRNVKEEEFRNDIYELGVSPNYILNGF